MLSRRNVLAAGVALPLTAHVQTDSRPVLRVAVQALPPTLDPVESISNVGLRISDNVFDGLLRRDFTAECVGGGAVIRPHLATSVVQRDELTWVATLRQDVRMHDGRLLTAEDVADSFSAERLWGPKAPFSEGKVAWGHLHSVTAESPSAVAFRTRTRDVVLPLRLSAYPAWVGSKAAFAAVGEEGWRQRPIGSGPYRVGSVQRDQRVVLDSNDDYFQGRPGARQVVLTAVPEASTRLWGCRPVTST